MEKEQRIRIFICVPSDSIIPSFNNAEDLVIMTALDIDGVKDTLEGARFFYQIQDKDSGNFRVCTEEEFFQQWDIREFSAHNLNMFGYWKVNNLPPPQELHT